MTTKIKNGFSYEKGGWKYISINYLFWKIFIKMNESSIPKNTNGNQASEIPLIINDQVSILKYFISNYNDYF